MSEEDAPQTGPVLILYRSIANQAASIVAEVHRVTNCPAPISQSLENGKAGPQRPDNKSLQGIIHLNSSHGRTRGRSSHLPQKWTWTGRLTFGFSMGGPVLSIQAPTWLASSMYSIIAESTVCGPQLTLRRYETIEAWGSEVHDAVAMDDLPGLLEGARSTGLSLFSTDPRGTNLLQVGKIRIEIRE